MIQETSLNQNCEKQGMYNGVFLKSLSILDNIVRTL